MCLTWQGTKMPQKKGHILDSSGLADGSSLTSKLKNGAFFEVYFSY